MHLPPYRYQNAVDQSIYARGGYNTRIPWLIFTDHFHTVDAKLVTIL